MAHKWPSRAVSILAPATADVDRFCDFIRNVFAKDGIDTMVLLVRYRFAFNSHPECRDKDPLSREDVNKIASVCRECGIHLIPKMNMLGHQSGPAGKEPEGLLVSYPQFDENKGAPVSYRRTLCCSEPKAHRMLLDLADEMIEAFGADTFHIGCDEVFEIGKCDRCRKVPTHLLYANWVNGIVDHLYTKGIKVWMWGDRFLNAEETGYGEWEASANGTDRALPYLRKGLVICDWHYEDCEKYDSPAIFAEAGFPVYLGFRSERASTKKFMDYADAHDEGNILGLMQTIWIPTEVFMNCYEGKPFERTAKNTEKTEAIVDNYRYLFEEN